MLTLRGEHFYLAANTSVSPRTRYTRGMACSRFPAIPAAPAASRVWAGRHSREAAAEGLQGFGGCWRGVPDAGVTYRIEVAGQRLARAADLTSSKFSDFASRMHVSGYITEFHLVRIRAAGSRRMASGRAVVTKDYAVFSIRSCNTLDKEYK